KESSLACAIAIAGFFPWFKGLRWGDEAAGAANGGSHLIAPPVSVSKAQFGSKWGKHGAEDYGFSPGDANARAWYMQRIREVNQAPDIVKRGPYNPNGGGGDNYFFFLKGEDLVITKPDGEFVSMFPGKENAWFKNAEVFNH
ncbi:hypothetical protein ACFVJS_11230, partial [Nocardioides sp. NPDC057772]|uniref:hypothetical protein n=1 Tax=Nocardioides sp. NPDC057772 TaxID=3346245 RepID=UPI00366CDFC8